MPKTISFTKKDTQPLLDAIPDDEPIFVLRAQDLFAPGAIEAWAKMIGNVPGHDPKLVEKANECIAVMNTWRPRKLPD